MSYAGMATNIIGGEMQGWASVLDQQAMGRAYQDEIARQAAYRDQAMQDFTSRLPSYSADTARQQIGQGAQNRMSQYQQGNATPLGVVPSWQQSGSSARDLALANQFGANRAQLGGYGDWMHQQGQQQIEQARALNQILSFSKGTASVFPYRMYAAQHAWDKLAMIGQAISSIGGGAANYAQYAQGPKQDPNQNPDAQPYPGSDFNP